MSRPGPERRKYADVLHKLYPDEYKMKHRWNQKPKNQPRFLHATYAGLTSFSR